MTDWSVPQLAMSVSVPVYTIVLLFRQQKLTSLA